MRCLDFACETGMTLWQPEDGLIYGKLRQKVCVVEDAKFVAICYATTVTNEDTLYHKSERKAFCTLRLLKAATI